MLPRAQAAAVSAKGLFGAQAIYLPGACTRAMPPLQTAEKFSAVE
jgi:hypothetical protein